MVLPGALVVSACVLRLTGALLLLVVSLLSMALPLGAQGLRDSLPRSGSPGLQALPPPGGREVGEDPGSRVPQLHPKAVGFMEAAAAGRQA